MTPSASFLLLLLLGLSQALPLQEEGSEEEEEVQDPVDITARILTTNNGSNELLWEGDLLVPKTRNAIKCWVGHECSWRKSSNGRVIIPFTVDPEFSGMDRQKIDKAMRVFHIKTCIRFTPRKSETDYISIENRKGCYSYLGKVGGRQEISLQKYGCMYHGLIQHEILHALGFEHEQSRSDRDFYIKINWQNIDSENANNFDKADTNNLNTPYDYSSVMHYGRTAFSRSRGDSMTPIPDPNVEIGQRQGMSTLDIERINLLYKC